MNKLPNAVRIVLVLAMLGGIVYFGSGLAGRVASKV